MKDRWGRLLLLLYVALVGFGGLVSPEKNSAKTRPAAAPLPPLVFAAPCDAESSALDPACSIWREPPKAEPFRLAGIDAAPSLENGPRADAVHGPAAFR